MNKKQKKALEESISHWERMRDNPECGEIPHGNDCACCKMCADDAGNIDCTLCPIMKYTGKKDCHRTPFYMARRYFYKRTAAAKVFKRWAQKEIDFLNEVLEAG